MQMTMADAFQACCNCLSDNGTHKQIDSNIERVFKTKSEMVAHLVAPRTPLNASGEAVMSSK